jgi:hypothetical protein
MLVKELPSTFTSNVEQAFDPASHFEAKAQSGHPKHQHYEAAKEAEKVAVKAGHLTAHGCLHLQKQRSQLGSHGRVRRIAWRCHSLWKMVGI